MKKDALNKVYKVTAFNYPSSIVNVLNEAYSAPDYADSGEAIMEILKSFHAVNDINANVSFNRDGFLLEGASPQGSFAMATELEGESHVSNSLHSGVSSLDSNWYLDFKAYDNPDDGATLDAYTHYDVIFLVNAHTGQITRSY